jgi:hypothetical protein
MRRLSRHQKALHRASLTTGISSSICSRAKREKTRRLVTAYKMPRTNMMQAIPSLDVKVRRRLFNYEDLIIETTTNVNTSPALKTYRVYLIFEISYAHYLLVDTYLMVNNLIDSMKHSAFRRCTPCLFRPLYSKSSDVPGDCDHEKEACTNCMRIDR